MLRWRKCRGFRLQLSTVNNCIYTTVFYLPNFALTFIHSFSFSHTYSSQNFNPDIFHLGYFRLRRFHPQHFRLRHFHPRHFHPGNPNSMQLKISNTVLQQPNEWGPSNIWQKIQHVPSNLIVKEVNWIFFKIGRQSAPPPHNSRY